MLFLYSRKSKTCGAGCARFVLTPNVNELCDHCLLIAFVKFIQTEEANGTKQHRITDSFLRKPFKL